MRVVYGDLVDSAKNVVRNFFALHIFVAGQGIFLFLLLFLFLGYLALRAAFDDRDRADRVSAILAVVGVVLTIVFTLAEAVLTEE